MLEWTVTSSVLILVVLAIRFGFRKRLSLRVRYALWLAVALRLLIPVTFSESAFSVLNLLPENRETMQENSDIGGQVAENQTGIPGPDSYGQLQDYDTNRQTQGSQAGEQGHLNTSAGQDDSKTTVNEGPESGQAADDIVGMSDMSGNASEGNTLMENQDMSTGIIQTGAGSQHSAPDAGLVAGDDSSEMSETGLQAAGKSGLFTGSSRSLLRRIWLAGAVVGVLLVAALNLRLMLRLRRSRRMLDPQPLESLPVYVSGAVETPCLFGVLRPVIYLVPEAVESPEGLRYVLRHENVHYRHHDNIWSLVRAVCLCLHWYNPLVWLAASLSRQDGELACDETTIRQLGEDERLDYGMKLLEFCAKGRMSLSGFTLATTMSGGKRRLRERLQMIAEQPKKTAGAVAAVLLIIMLVLAVTFTGRQVVQQAEPLQVNAEEQQNGDGREPGEQESESDAAQSYASDDEIEPWIFGYNNYTGYLDECLQWGDSRDNFKDQDYDNDGLTDRVWRENVEDWAVANYRIEFGNGDVIQMDGLGGGIPQVRSVDLTGDGVPEILYTQSYDYSTDPTVFGEMALFEKTPDGYRQMELPGGMIKEPEDHVDMYLWTEHQHMYWPTLTCHFEQVGESALRITCLETAEEVPLDVTVDFSGDSMWDLDGWNGYKDIYPGNDYESAIWNVDVEERENELPRLKLHTRIIDRCSDEVTLTLVYRDGALHMEDVEYYHYYEGVFVPIDLGDGEIYSLEMEGGILMGSGMYQLNWVTLWHYLDQDKSQREFIESVDLTVGGAWDKWDYHNRPSSFSPDGGILVADLNFDGAQDICLQMWEEGQGAFYYCFVWEPEAQEFVYVGTLSGEEGQQLACSAQMGEVSVTGYYYMGENSRIVLDRFVMEDASPDALFDTLELTYRQTPYSMPAIKDYDYGIYNGKEQADLVYWAMQALKELHQWTGIKVDSACFTMTDFGDVIFARTEADLLAGRTFYSRCYGAEAGFRDAIQSVNLATERTVWYSPVQFQLFPDNMDRMSSEETVSWYFEKWAEEDGEKVADIEKILEDTFVIRAESGNYYEVIYSPEINGIVSAIYGPYPDYPQH